MFLKSSFQSYSYLLNYNPFENVENDVKAIQILFENDDTTLPIQNKMEKIFPLDSQDVITQDAIVVFNPKNDYSSQFLISDGSCIRNDKMNTSLTHDYQTTEHESENTKADRKIAILISFDNDKNLLMNGFIS